MANLPLPQFTDTIDIRYFLEALDAGAHPSTYLEDYPDSLYSKSPDSHFVRFMYTLLGPVGTGWLKADLAEARLQLEAAGLSLFNLDAFYGDPFAFTRLLTESFSSDVSALLPASEWDQIRAEDEAYRSRALEYIIGAQLGGTPFGMQLVASSGLGQNTEIIENYKALFDLHSDDPLHLPYIGRSRSLGEFIVVPRPEVSRSIQQSIMFEDAAVPFAADSFTLDFNGYSATFPATATAADVQGSEVVSGSGQISYTGLWGLRSIGAGNVVVTGGPAPAAFIVTFARILSNQTMPKIKATFIDSSAGLTSIPVVVTTGAIDPSGENVIFAAADKQSMQTALDYIRPVPTFPTFFTGRSTIRPQFWNNVAASTEYASVTRYVTGSPSISWPATDTTHWIEPAIENEALQLQNGSSQNYLGWHNAASIHAYTDQALADPGYLTNNAMVSAYNSEHIGPFPEMDQIMPFFQQFDTSYSLVFSADLALAPQPQPLAITAVTADNTPLINGVYPADYTTLQGAPPITPTPAFWSSVEREGGADLLEIDLGSVQAVNYIALEVTRKPVTIAIAYDLLDSSPARTFIPIVPVPGYPVNNYVFADPSQQNPWEYLTFYFNDGLNLVFTRFIRLTFTRRNDSSTYGRFLYDTATQSQTPWSIDVRNLRIGRNIAPAAE